jgi:hypothetical protein
MREIDELSAGTVTYLKFESSGVHNRQFVDLLGLPNAVAEALRRDLDGRHLNRSLSHKQAVICLNRDLFSTRTGIDLRGAVLRAVVSRGELEFERDGPCGLLDDRTRRDLHERVLASACLHGFDPYVEFFAEDELGSSSPVRLSPDVVTDKDLSRLVECISTRAHTT